MKSYSHLTIEERHCLEKLYKANNSVRQTAKILGRNISTISRELNRNCTKNEAYRAVHANKLYRFRRKQSIRKLRIFSDSQLLKFIEVNLNKAWSPEIIVARWKLKNPDSKLSFTTIYSNLKRKLFKRHTPEKHLRRRDRRKYTGTKCHTIKPDYKIRDWPQETIQRARLGDWEGDTLNGGRGKGAVITLVDRKSRFLKMHLVKTKTAEETYLGIKKALVHQPIHSISLDNGSEFAHFRKLQKDLGVPVYFADPHSPWQRGSNENVNGLLRFFFPKGFNFLEITQKEIRKVQFLINNRPRKCLGWLSPKEFVSAECCT